LGAARNNGARVARGAFLLFLDDDNIMLPQMVSTLVSAAQRSSSKVAVNGHFLWEPTSDISAPPTTAAQLKGLRSWIPVGPAAVAGLKGNVFGSANFLISKDTFFALSGFTEDRAGWEDYEFHAKAALSGIEYVVVPEALMLYRIHARGSQMSFAGTMDFSRVLRAYRSVVQDADLSSVHHMNERTVTTCSIVAVSGSCTSGTITVLTTGNGQNYLGAGAGSPSLSTGAGGADPVAGSLFSSTGPAGGSDNGNWTITVNVPAGTPNPFSSLPLLTVSFGRVTCSRQLTSADLSCGNICFHKDTVVSYNGRAHTLADFTKDHSECRIPHIVKSRGVIVHSTCASKPLRLTNEHLVFSARGLVAAEDLKHGDVVFHDVAQSRPCQVVRVEKEKEVQEYFGLNCLNSVVLADGVKTSTFGKLHTLPAVWFSWMGRVAGIERATRWGDALAQLAYNFKLL